MRSLVPATIAGLLLFAALALRAASRRLTNQAIISEPPEVVAFDSTWDSQSTVISPGNLAQEGGVR